MYRLIYAAAAVIMLFSLIAFIPILAFTSFVAMVFLLAVLVV